MVFDLQWRLFVDLGVSQTIYIAGMLRSVKVTEYTLRGG